MLGIPAGGQPMMGGTPWGALPFVPAYGGVPPPILCGCSTPATLVFGGMPPLPGMGGGTPAFGGVMGQVMPQFGA